MQIEPHFETKNDKSMSKDVTISKTALKKDPGIDEIYKWIKGSSDRLVDYLTMTTLEKSNPKKDSNIRFDYQGRVENDYAPGWNNQKGTYVKMAIQQNNVTGSTNILQFYIKKEIIQQDLKTVKKMMQRGVDYLLENHDLNAGGIKVRIV